MDGGGECGAQPRRVSGEAVMVGWEMIFEKGDLYA